LTDLRLLGTSALVAFNKDVTNSFRVKESRIVLHSNLFASKSGVFVLKTEFKQWHNK
jgi:hypothetical protein